MQKKSLQFRSIARDKNRFLRKMEKSNYNRISENADGGAWYLSFIAWFGKQYNARFDLRFEGIKLKLRFQFQSYANKD